MTEKNRFDEITKIIGLRHDLIKDDLTLFYNRVKRNGPLEESVKAEWGSVENFVDLLYWMKFEKNYNLTQIKDITGKNHFPDIMGILGGDILHLILMSAIELMMSTLRIYGRLGHIGEKNRGKRTNPPASALLS